MHVLVERHRDRLGRRVHRRDARHRRCAPGATPEPSRNSPRRPDVHADADRIGTGPRRDIVGRRDHRRSCSQQRCADDPSPCTTTMHAKCPVHRDARACSAATACTSPSYDDVLWALKHPEVFSSKDVVDIGERVPAHPAVGRSARPREVPPPARSRVLARRRWPTLEPEARKLVNEIIDTFADTRRSATSTTSSRRRCRRRSSSRSSGLPQNDLPATSSLARRHDPARRRTPRRRSSAEAPGRGPGDQRVLRSRARREAEEPRRPAAHAAS